MSLEKKISYKEATLLVSNNDGPNTPFGRLNSLATEFITEFVSHMEDFDVQSLIDHANQEATSSLLSGKPVRILLTIESNRNLSFKVSGDFFDWFVIIPPVLISHIGDFDKSEFSF